MLNDLEWQEECDTCDNHSRYFFQNIAIDHILGPDRSSDFHEGQIQEKCAKLAVN